jgi:hypothetical protein
VVAAAETLRHWENSFVLRCHEFARFLNTDNAQVPARLVIDTIV